MGPAWDRHGHSFFTESELEAAFLDLPPARSQVMDHPASAGAAKAARRLSAHSVEHGYIMDDERLALFREHDAWYVPTLGITPLTPVPRIHRPQDKASGHANRSRRQVEMTC